MALSSRSSMCRRSRSFCASDALRSTSARAKSATPPAMKKANSQKANRTPIVREARSSRAKNIADAPHGVDQAAGESGIDLGAQPRHQDLDHVRLGVEIEGPHVLQDHGARDRPPGIPGEIFEQA